MLFTEHKFISMVVKEIFYTDPHQDQFKARGHALQKFLPDLQVYNMQESHNHNKVPKEQAVVQGYTNDIILIFSNLWLKQKSWIKVKVFMQSFHGSLHINFMSMAGQLDCQVDVHSRYKLQDVNTEIYQVRCGLCVEKFESNCSTLLDELNHVCHMTLVRINIVCRFKSSYGHKNIVTNLQLPIPSVRITLTLKSVIWQIYTIFLTSLKICRLKGQIR